MTPALIVDGIIILIVVLAFWSGWRQGAFSSVLSTVGVIAGLVVGAGLAPFVMQLTESVPIRFLLALATVVLLVGLGNLVGGMIGASVRDRMRMRASQNLDSTIGAIFVAAATVVMVWLVSIPLATGIGGGTAQGIRGSTVLSYVDRFTPPSLNQLPDQISSMLTESGLPPLSPPFDAPSAREVEAPDITVEDVALVEEVRPSVTYVMGDAEVCQRRLMGSGFVTAPDYVLTNAHVVAGTQEVRLDTVLGVRDAEVVYYNPEIDIAVLHSPGLDLPVLRWAEETAASGDDAVVMGFPGSGPFDASPARIRDSITIAGPDIYATGRVEREAYIIRGDVRQGNSGGPLLNTDGDALGLIFGASVDQTDTGYAITAAEVQRQVGDVAALTAPVGTGACVAG